MTDNIKRKEFVLNLADCFSEFRPKESTPHFEYAEWSDLVWSVFTQMEKMAGYEELRAIFLDNAMRRYDD